MTEEELSRSSDVFTIELMDMQQHHRIAYGEDVLSTITSAAALYTASRWNMSCAKNCCPAAPAAS